ncbi:dihydrofolate reductase [Fructilactobacillus fructivorans]|uniref:dihydrofolate reductase n=1 Tax=Fructilactobacillus fructivorans TaxID=1614 RepID=UPI0007048E3F|nr:dihydrofolate reductase [Fructilactobacillus fructivorans]KRN43449.1 dihydrofolate reductase region [Fructilactobacillus fructivorans]
MLAYIWAEASNHVIGKNGKLPWHLPDDMQFFKDQTINHQILAGKRTYDSFGRPLPKRKNLVLTHFSQADFPAGVKVFKTIDEFLQYAKGYPNEVIFVVGGTSVFKELLPYVDYLYRTSINHGFNGDVRMIDIDYSQFELEQQIPGKVDKNNIYPHTFDVFKRKK